MNVAIDIREDTFYPFKVTPPPRKSIIRQWQRLTRLQKSIVYLLIVSAILLITYKYKGEGTSSRKSLPYTITSHHETIQVAEKVVDNHHINILEDDNHEDSKKKEPEDIVNDRAIDYDKLANKEDNDDDTEHDDLPLQFEGPTNDKQKAVVEAFKHSWRAYKRSAWGKDELQPLSKSYHTWFDLGLTLVDSLDTMYIMGLKEEFNEARTWVANELDFVKGDVNLFETTIRVLGGLLSSYHLTRDDMFLQKARDLGDRLLPCFSSQSGVPYSDVNLKSGKPHAPRWGPDSSTSEVTTIQLEFNDLSKATGDNKYKNAVRKVREHVHSQQKTSGLVPIFINAQTGMLRDSATITLGARGDSYYEYLLKEWIQTGKTDELCKGDYIEAVLGIRTLLMKQSMPGGLWYIGELLSGRKFSPKMDHLVAFIAGTLALGNYHGLPEDHMTMAKNLMITFREMYSQMPAKLSPEIVYFSTSENAPSDLIVKPADAHNLQRPETVESLYYLYWLTGDKKYQDWGWDIFQAFEQHSKIEEGYCSLNSVKVEKPSCRDKMESFWLGETLKYFYLLFADKNLFSFDEWVFNTEAHPLPVFNRQYK